MNDTKNWKLELHKIACWNKLTRSEIGDLSFFIETLLTQERTATVKECLEKVDEYFDGLISIPLPQLTKESLKDSLNNLIGD